MVCAAGSAVEWTSAQSRAAARIASPADTTVVPLRPFLINCAPRIQEVSEGVEQGVRVWAVGATVLAVVAMALAFSSTTSGRVSEVWAIDQSDSPGKSRRNLYLEWPELEKGAASKP